MEKLPIDVLNHIITYLDNAVYLRLVNKRLNEKYKYEVKFLITKKNILKVPCNFIIIELQLSKEIKDEDIIKNIKKLKNVKTLKCGDNDNLTDEGINKLPLTTLDCGENKKFTDEGIKGLPLTTLDCGENEKFTDEGIKGLPLTTLKCRCNRNFTDEGIKGLPLTTLDCGKNNRITIRI